MKTTFPVLLFVLALMSGCKTTYNNDLTDDFETDTLSSIWTDDKLLPGAIYFQTEHVRSGSKAVKLTLNPGDQIEEEKGTILERAELKEPKKLASAENSSCEYSFSIYMPSDFPVVPVRLVIAQWKHNCQSGNCDPDNPVIALRYSSGELSLTIQTGPERKTLFSTSDEIRGRWLDMKFFVRFSRDKTGILKVWLNKEQIVDYSGPTAYPEKYGYPEQGIFYFKMGLYRDHMDQAMTIYLDNYSKKISD